MKTEEALNEIKRGMKEAVNAIERLEARKRLRWRVIDGGVIERLEEIV